MAFKRLLPTKTLVGTKKRKTLEDDEDSDDSIQEWSQSSRCWACWDGIDVMDCIHIDLSAEEYFNLAAIIINPSQLSIYPESDKLKQLLRNSAGTLSSRDIRKILNKIHTFILHSSSKEIADSIESIMEKHRFHNNREVAFVIGMINTLKESSNSEVVRRIKENDSESMKDILLLNPRFSRLIALLALAMREDEPLSPGTSMAPTVYEMAVDSNDDLEYENNSSSSMIDTTVPFSYSAMSIEDNSSHLILPVPSQIISQSITNAQSFTDSQSGEHLQPSSPCELFTQTSFSVLDNNETIELTTTPSPPAQAPPSPSPTPQSPATALPPPPPPPPPDYDDLSTNEIKAKLRSYGFKPASRAVMINYLEQIRLSPRISNSQSSTGTSSRTTAQDASFADKSVKVMQYLRSQDDLWKKILEFEQIDIGEIRERIDVSCNINELKAIFSEYVSHTLGIPNL